MGKKKMNAKNGEGVKRQISLRLPAELLEQIQRLAKSERRNRSGMIEWILTQAIKEGKA